MARLIGTELLERAEVRKELYIHTGTERTVQQYAGDMCGDGGQQGSF